MRARPEIALATGLAERLFKTCVMARPRGSRIDRQSSPEYLIESEDGGASDF